MFILNRIFLIGLAALALFVNSATAAPLPSAREPHQNYLDEAFELMPRVRMEVATPWNMQLPLDRLDVSRAPMVESMALLQQMFERVRDLRGWKWSEKPEFARRIPWLYVDDGCYLRAEMIVEKFREWKYAVPRQVMVFGNLQGQSEHGSVTWWFHVAPIFSFGGQAYVLDPSIEGRRPLALQEWVLKMVPNVQSAGLSICNADVVDPEQDCYTSQSGWSADYEAQQLDMFLGLEWKKLSASLGIEPVRILGDEPPWSKPEAALK